MTTLHKWMDSTAGVVDIDGDGTLVDAIKYVAANSLGGVQCPCCKRKVKQWRKSPSVGGLISLLILVRKWEGESMHLTDFMRYYSDATNFSQLHWWGLVVPDEKDSDADGSSGFWSPTKKGIEFVDGLVDIPRYVVTDGNNFVRHEGEYIFIYDRLKEGEAFSWKGLMCMNYGELAKWLNGQRLDERERNKLRKGKG